MANRKAMRRNPSAAMGPPLKHPPKGKGGGLARWIAYEGIPLDAVPKLTGQFTADLAKLKGNVPCEDILALAACYWLGYPVWSEQVGIWWGQNAARSEAHEVLDCVHHQAAEVLMEAAERAGIDSGPIMESALWCQRLFAEPNTWRATGETWPQCFDASRDSLPDGAFVAIQRGYAAFMRLSAKLAIAPNGGPRSAPDVIFCGNGLYRSGQESIVLDGQEANVMQALVELQAATKDTLVNRSGVGDAVNILKRIKRKYPLLADSIIMPGGRGRGGYRTTVRKA